MKQHFFHTFPALFFATALMVSQLSEVPDLSAQSASPRKSGNASQATLETYAHSDGVQYFEFALQAPRSAAQIPNEVIFLLDTSAIHVGIPREDQLQTLRATISQLPANTSVQLVAVDTTAEPYTTDFVEPQGADIADAVNALEDQRTPLGAADLQKGIDEAVSLFQAQGQPNARRTVIYLGNGMGTGQVVTEKKLKAFVDTLVEEKISFTAVPIGIGANVGIVGALAFHTGGIIVSPVDCANEILLGDDNDLSGRTALAGKYLAESVEATVLWAQDNGHTFPAQWDIYPSAIPPIRSDRETFFFGKTTSKIAPANISISAQPAAGSAVRLTKTLQPTASKPENQYLVGIVQNAMRDQGLAMPFAGRAILKEIQQDNSYDRSILDVAEQALADGRTESAMQLAQGVGERNSRLAKSVESILDRAAQAPPNPRLNQEWEAAPASMQDTNNTVVDTYQKSHSIRVQSLSNAVTVAIADAEKLMYSQPEVALQTLKLMKVQIENETSLPATDRAKILDRLEQKIRSAYHSQQVAEIQRIESDARAAELENQRMLGAAWVRNEEKVKQIFERFRALSDDGKYFQAEAAADYAIPLVPHRSSPPTASLWARTAGHVDKIEGLKLARNRGFLDVLMSVEESFVPLSDEPPMLYPDPQVWEALSARRKELYEVVDLSNAGEAEKKIIKALDYVLDDEFYVSSEDTPSYMELADKMREKFGINVDFDYKALEDAALTPDQSFQNATFTGIQLRKAFRRVLAQNDLTFCIRDECLLITTAEGAKKKMPIKVYPVGDLVVSPEPMEGNNNNNSSTGGNNSNSNSNSGGNNRNSGGNNRNSGGGNRNYNMSSGSASKYEKLLKHSLMNSGVMGNSGFFAVPPVRKQAAHSTTAAQSATTQSASSKVVAKNVVKNPAKNAVARANTPGNSVAEKPMKMGKIDFKSMNWENPDLYWNDVFSKPFAERPNEINVARAAVYMLSCMSKDAKYGKQLSSMLQHAIKAGEVQPWMYEVLAMALKTQNAPQEEIDRVILSARSFNDDPIELLTLAVYMQQMGSPERALELYKDVAEMMPMRPEPLAYALRLADIVQDEDAIKTLSLAAASQPWDARWIKSVFQNGVDMAQSLIETMKQEGRIDEASEFENELNEALKRDCVVIVEYSGDAKLDLYVKEPTETFCWFNNPRTISGGILLKYPLAENETLSQTPLNRLVYVCPKAFAGEYQVVVKADYGRIANDKFRMRIYTNRGSDEERVIDKYHTIGEDGALVKFELEKGRLDESFKEEDIEAALVSNEQVESRINVSRKLAAFSSSAPLADMNNSSSTVKGGGTTSEGGSAPVAQTGNAMVNNMSVQDWIYRNTEGNALGYETNIEWFSDGPQLDVYNLVVSADRRYVRMSPAPYFSTIKNVFTYNTRDGSQTSNNSGSGSNSNSNSSNNSSNNSSY